MVVVSDDLSDGAGHSRSAVGLVAASDGRFKYLKGYTTTTPPIVPRLSPAAAIYPAGSGDADDGLQLGGRDGGDD